MIFQTMYVHLYGLGIVLRYAMIIAFKNCTVPIGYFTKQNFELKHNILWGFIFYPTISGFYSFSGLLVA